MITTSTAILLRFVCKRAGLGTMVKVPGVMPELAQRICDPEAVLEGYNAFSMRQKWYIVQVEPGTVKYLTDLREIPTEALRRDRTGIEEVLMRLAISHWELNPILPEELGHLTDALGFESPWVRRIPVIGQ